MLDKNMESVWQAEIEVLERRINDWPDKSRPEFRRMVERKQLLQRELDTLREGQRLRLEKSTLRASESRREPHETPANGRESLSPQLKAEPARMTIWRRGPDPPVIRDLVNFSIPSGCTDADIVLKITEMCKLGVEGMPDALREIQHPRGITIFRSAAEVLDEITAKHQNLYWTVSGAVLRFETRDAGTAGETSALKPTIEKPEVRLHRTCWGRNIDILRKECGWSFDALAEKTGLDKKLILLHVNKSTKPRPSTMKLYAQAFGKALNRNVSVADLEK